MALRVETKNRTVKLVIPKRASIRSAYEFALKNAEWIQQSIDELPKPIRFTHGTKLPVLGKDRIINVSYTPSAKVTDIDMTDDAINVVTNKQDASSRIRRYLMDIAKQELTAMAHEKAERIDQRFIEFFD